MGLGIRIAMCALASASMTTAVSAESWRSNDNNDEDEKRGISLYQGVEFAVSSSSDGGVGLTGVGVNASAGVKLTRLRAGARYTYLAMDHINDGPLAGSQHQLAGDVRYIFQDFGIKELNIGLWAGASFGRKFNDIRGLDSSTFAGLALGFDIGVSLKEKSFALSYGLEVQKGIREETMVCDLCQANQFRDGPSVMFLFGITIGEKW